MLDGHRSMLRIGRLSVRRVGASLVLTAILLLGAAGAVLASPDIREYVYRRISYQVLADHVALHQRNSEQVAARMMEYVGESLYPGGGVVRDDTVLTDLI